MILDFVIRHDRDADLVRFEDNPHHGYFIEQGRNKLLYTIMATGDNIELEDGRPDRGLGRVLYFSTPRLLNGLVIGDSSNDNARKITISRALILCMQKYHEEKYVPCFKLLI